jgi:hypothetical protein
VAAALPGPGDVPAGWEPSGKPRHESSGDDGRIAFGTAGFQALDLDGAVGFTISSYATTADAIARFTVLKGQYGSAAGPITMAGTEQAFAAKGCITENFCSGTIVARVGQAVVTININTRDSRAPDPRMLNTAARMQIERVRQAQQGHTPTAKAI